MDKIKTKRKLRQLMPLIVTILSFTTLLAGTLSYSNYKKDRWEKDIKIRILEVLMTKKAKLEVALYSRIYYTKSVAAYVSQNPGLLNREFYNLASELIDGDSIISTMALSENCIIDAIFPKQGHEAAIGLNLLAHPQRKEIVEKTIKTHKTFVAGPVELVEGGIAFISYTPIFDKTNREKETFWGVTDIVIYRDGILKEASLFENDPDFSFALKGYNGLGADGALWWGDEAVFEQNPVTVDVKLPDGNWILAAIPKTGWDSYLNQNHVFLMLLILSSFIISILIWVISRAIVRIKSNEQELQAVFHSMDSLILEFNHEGRYIKIPPVNSELLAKPKEELLNKTLFEVFPEEKARAFYNAIRECLEKKRRVEIEYSLQVGDTDKWFIARITWKSEQSVIFHAIDITGQKNDRKRIADSERRLKKLNATKDRFFSIIAHDLTSPFNSLIGFSELLIEEINDGNFSNVEKYTGYMHQTSTQTYNLVLNLLEWSRSQSEDIEFNPKTIDLADLTDTTRNLLLNQAQKKSIALINNIPPGTEVVGDKNMLKTIVRNLMSNAIKYTHENGVVAISVSNTENGMQIEVSDTGIGISKESIGKLFRIENTFSMLGTQNEKGTGLGLILCKEFIEKHNGRIWVESEVGKGSVFKFTLPKNGL